MKAEGILQTDLLDILFDKRNKSYGAYNLRRYYPRRLWLAVAISLVFVTGAILLLRRSGQAMPEVFASDEVVLRSIEIPVEVIPPPPPPPAVPEKEKTVQRKSTSTTPRVQTPKVKTTKFTTPVVREDKDVKESELPPVADIATIDLVSSEGITTDIILPPRSSMQETAGTIESKGIVTVPEEDKNKIFEKVEIAASVDQQRWRRHLQQNLVRFIEDAAAEGMPSGQYTVMVRFLVERDGSIKNVRALNDPGYGLASGAEQVVKSGPKWEAGIQNGNKVRSYHTQPISFVIMES